jgi:hypothetical protein
MSYKPHSINNTITLPCSIMKHTYRKDGNISLSFDTWPNPTILHPGEEATFIPTDKGWEVKNGSAAEQ